MDSMRKALFGSSRKEREPAPTTSNIVPAPVVAQPLQSGELWNAPIAFSLRNSMAALPQRQPATWHTHMYSGLHFNSVHNVPLSLHSGDSVPWCTSARPCGVPNFQWHNIILEFRTARTSMFLIGLAIL